MDKELDIITVVDEEGKEVICEIILTVDNEDFDKSYVIYQIKGDETGEVFAASYEPSDDGEGQLNDIKTDAEWDFIEEVLESFDDE